MRAERPAWQRYQLAFARHVREPAVHTLPPGVAPDRMQVYATLMFNNIDSVVSACFPVLSSLLGQDKWQAVVKAFFVQHRCQSPLIRDVPAEFLQYLQNTGQTHAPYPDFMHELAHYEWIELSLSISNLDTAVADYNLSGDLLTAIPVLNPVMANLAYRYPVHLISPDFQPAEAPAQATHILVYRDAADDIRFNLLNPISAHLINLLMPELLTGQMALHQLAVDIQHAQPETLIKFGAELLLDLQRQGCILGTRNIGE